MLIITILQSFSSIIKDRLTGVELERFNFDIVNGSVINRGWNLEQEFQNQVTFTPEYGFETGKDQYFINHAFTIKESWYQNDNIVLEWVAAYNQTLDDGTEVFFTTGRQSLDFMSNTYDETRNTSSEPQTLAKTGTPTFFNYTGDVLGDEVSKLIQVAGAKTLIRYTFEDNNLDDLQAVPATPRPFIFDFANIQKGSLCGYLDLIPNGGTPQERYRFHSAVNNSASFWEEVQGHPDYASKLTALDDGGGVSKTATLRGGY